MPALYLSQSHTTAIAEYMQSLIHPGTLTPYDLSANSILDLTDRRVRLHLGFDDALLDSPWRTIRDIDKQDPATWEFARQAVGTGFDGLCVRSVQDRGTNLVLWKWGEQGAQVRVVDSSGDLG